MTTLPRLIPKETSVHVISTPQQQQPYFGRSHTFVDKSKPLSKSWAGMTSLIAHQHTRTPQENGSLPRINPLRPPRMRRTVTLETTDAHFLNDHRSNSMKRTQYHRFHSAWAKPFYGNEAEQEYYRKDIRDVLKGQMSTKEDMQKQHLKDKVKESEDAVSHDNKCLKEDSDAYKKKATFLMQFRDENKRLIESREEQRHLDHKYQHRNEQELLRFNPINWSQTLR